MKFDENLACDNKVFCVTDHVALPEVIVLGHRAYSQLLYATNRNRALPFILTHKSHFDRHGAVNDYCRKSVTDHGHVTQPFSNSDVALLYLAYEGRRITAGDSKIIGLNLSGYGGYTITVIQIKLCKICYFQENDLTFAFEKYLSQKYGYGSFGSWRYLHLQIFYICHF